MRKAEVENIFGRLNEAGVRYLVAGGLAVVAHGYPRYTDDIDIALAMERENLLKAVEVLDSLGYRPRVPVALKDLADDDKRRQWIEEKHALVLNLDGKQPDDVTVDLFLQFPFDFDAEWEKAERKRFGDGVEVPVLALQTLIAMKDVAGRPKDQDDSLQLKRIQMLRETHD
ncbi:nucleotidyltransferase family protein [Candidatus Sumerlaeota bacterium]|nr:nucleotidyltransferase family protein [Candidatus Sumerlaeota bacterium]